MHTDRVHAGVEHAKRDLGGVRDWTVVQHENIGKAELRELFGDGAPELVAHGAK